MKILLTNKAYYPHIGGVETVVRQVARGMRERGHEVKVLCFAESDVTECLENIEIRRVRYLKKIGSAPVGFSFISQYRELARWADVINIHSPNPMGEIAVLACKTNKSIICTYHGDAQRPKFLIPSYDALIKTFFKRCNSVLVTNPNIVDSSRVLAAIRGKIHVVPLGIDTESFADIPEASMTESDALVAPLTDSSFRILFAGRLVYYKGVGVLLRALSLLIDKGLDVSCIIVGSGPLEPELRSYISDRNLTDKVLILQHQPQDIYRALFSSADCFVLPSTHPTEAYGIVIAEALASGLPVVSTELGTGTSWVNVDEKTGLVVAPGSPVALASALERIYGDSALRKQMGENALCRAHDILSEKKMLDSYEELFERTVRGSA